MEEFIKQLSAIGYRNIIPMKVNRYRKERLYFSTESIEGERVFIKWLLNDSQIEKKEIAFEKKIGKILGGKEYPVPPQYSEKCVASEYIESVGDIKSIIKKDNSEEALSYIRASIENYLSLLERLNSESVECQQHKYLKMVDIYIKRWAYYSKKAKMRKQMACLYFKIKARLKYATFIGKIEKVNYIILGDLNPGNCLCLPDKSVKCIDYEKVCFSDPNVDIASYIVKIRHHARNNQEILNGIELAVAAFKNSRFYNEINYKFAYEMFEYIDKNWS